MAGEFVTEDWVLAHKTESNCYVSLDDGEYVDSTDKLAEAKRYSFEGALRAALLHFPTFRPKFEEDCDES